jgi:hypothetical protein
VAAGWDADRYQRQFGSVSALAGDLLELLDPAMVATARRRLGGDRFVAVAEAERPGPLSFTGR